MALLRNEPAGAASPWRALLTPAPVTWLSQQLEAERAGWFYWQPVAFGTGCAIYFASPVEPGLWIIASLALVAVALIALRPSGTLPGAIVAVLALAALGFVAAKLRTEWVRAPVLEERLGPVDVRGFIELVEPKADGGERLTLMPLTIQRLSPDKLPQRIRVSTRENAGSLKPGDYVEFSARLSPPPRSAVPGGYDFARYAWFRGIGAVGYATTPPVRVGTDEPVSARMSLENRLAGLRKAIGDRITAALPGETGAIATALITGERGGISDETNEIYRAAGIYHILSISGLHMAVMGGSVFFALRFVLALWPAVALRYPIKKWAAGGAMLGALAYLLISGATFATVRAFLMITVMFFAILADRQAIALRNVAAAAFILLILFPECVTDPGFHMSFAAVVALVASYEALARRLAPPGAMRRGSTMRFALALSGIVLSTVIASAAVAPFAIYHFHQSQHYAVLGNLAAVPVCNLLVMPAALATLLLMPLGLEPLPLTIMGFGIDAMTTAANWVAGLGGAVSYVTAVPGAAILLVVAGGLWLALMSRPWRWAGVFAIAAGIAVAPTAQRPSVLVGNEANLVLVRGPGGVLNGIASSRDDYEVSQWLERDGDGRRAADVTPGASLPCDSQGCVGTVLGKTIAIARHPAALRDDCRQADLLIVAGRAPPYCPSPAVIIDRAAVEREGTHAVYIDATGGMRIETVEEARGDRPWTASGITPR